MSSHGPMAKLVLVTLCSFFGPKPRPLLLIGHLRGAALAERRAQLCNATARAVRARDLYTFLVSTNKLQRRPMCSQGALRNILLQAGKLLWGM